MNTIKQPTIPFFLPKGTKIAWDDLTATVLNDVTVTDSHHITISVDRGWSDWAWGGCLVVAWPKGYDPESIRETAKASAERLVEAFTSPAGEKTPGQVAYESWADRPESGCAKWEHRGSHIQALWERAARAVLAGTSRDAELQTQLAEARAEIDRLNYRHDTFVCKCGWCRKPIFSCDYPSRNSTKNQEAALKAAFHHVKSCAENPLRCELDEAKAEINKLKDQLAGLVVVGHRHGWNGLDNSKILSRFFDDALSMAEGVTKADADPVNHPAHYTSGEIECIDAILSALGPDGFQAFCRGNVIKYAWRADKKGKLGEDLAKAAWYAAKAKEVTE